MSQLYGLLAGLVVCASTWGTMAYLSQEVGWLVGIFLLVFFTVTTVYIHGEEIQERQDRATKALADMEIIFSHKLRQIDRKIEGLEGEGNTLHPVTPEGAPYKQQLDTMIHLVEQILNHSHSAPDATGNTEPVGSAEIGP